ncbi:MAG: hypothetical protein ABJG78_07360 [Cyclobacteriaceae bacterium]
MKNLFFALGLFLTVTTTKAQWTTIDVQNSPETTLFKHTGTSAPVPFNLQKIGYSGSSVSYGLLHLDMAHKTVGGGSNLHFRLHNSSNSFKEYGGIGAYILDNTSGSEDGGLTFYTTYNGQHRTRRMTILSNGYVGIGTTSVPEKLSVDGNINVTGDLKMSGSDSYIWTNGTGTGYTGIWDQKNGRVLLYTSENTGNIGLGTTTPNSKLTLQGDGTTAGSASINLKHSGNGMSIGLSSTSNNLVVGNSWNPESGTYLTIQDGTGKVGIGTSDFTGNHKLRVEGSVGAREIKVEASGWSDFVFEKGYDLRTLQEVEQHIKEKGHLPEIPSEAQVLENGINLGEMDAKLLQKIEELTVYMIDMNKQVQQLKIENQELKEKVQSLESE